MSTAGKIWRGGRLLANYALVLFWAIQTFGLPLLIVVNTPSSILGWLGALIWELLFIIALVHVWSTRRD
jgi:hypothetical protein